MDNDLIFVTSMPDVMYPLGRSVIWHDPRNRQFRALSGSESGDVLPPRSKTWASVTVFDQIGPSCTANAAVGVIRTSPNRFLKAPEHRSPYSMDYDTEQERFDLYKAAQLVDEMPGESYDGTSTDAPWKVLREAGAIAGWKWLFGIDEVRQWIMHHGPCAVGTNWYRSMFKPIDGYLTIDATKGIAGGHAWRVVGYSVSRQAFRMVNSWGRDWGESGRAWVKEDVMARLLSERGEAVTIG